MANQELPRELEDIERDAEAKRLQERAKLDAHVEEKLRPLPKNAPTKETPSDDKPSETSNS